MCARFPPLACSELLKVSRSSLAMADDSHTAADAHSGAGGGSAAAQPLLLGTAGQAFRFSGPDVPVTVSWCGCSLTAASASGGGAAGAGAARPATTASEEGVTAYLLEVLGAA